MPITSKIPFHLGIHSFLLVAPHTLAVCSGHNVGEITFILFLFYPYLLIYPYFSLQPTFIVMYIPYTRFSVPDSEIEHWANFNYYISLEQLIACETCGRCVPSTLQSTGSQIRNVDFGAESGVGG